MLQGEQMQWLRLKTALMGLKMLIDTNGRMMITRGANAKSMMLIVGEYTGKTYKRNQQKVALEDGMHLLANRASRDEKVMQVVDFPIMG